MFHVPKYSTCGAKFFWMKTKQGQAKTNAQARLYVIHCSLCDGTLPLQVLLDDPYQPIHDRHACSSGCERTSS